MIAPVLVAKVDLDAPLEGLSAARISGQRYSAARVLVTRGGKPVGTVDVPFDRFEVSADALRERLLVSNATWSRGIGDSLPSNGTGGLPFARLPSATVVVPSVFSRVSQLKRSVTALSALDHPDYEVVVVDNRSSPDPLSWEPLLTLPRVRVVAEPMPGISAARNRGVKEAHGEIIAFTDDDVHADSGWLRALSARFASQPDVDCLTGLVVAGELETSAQLLFERYDQAVGTRFIPETYCLVDANAGALCSERYTVVAYGSDGAEHRRFWLYQLGGFVGANMAFRASALASVGSFDEALGTGTTTRGGEDLEMFARLLFEGRSIGYEPAAFIWHTHRRTDPELDDQIWGYGAGCTAMLAACVWRDPRHVVGLSRAVLAVLGEIRSRHRGPCVEAKGRDTLAGEGSSHIFPKALRCLEHRGMAVGPYRYVRARLALARRGSRP